jgi:phage-related protein
MPTFPAAPAASQSSTGETQTNTQEVKFGNGYAVRIPEGINNLVENYNLVWKSITKTERDVLIAFLRARNGAQAFDYTLPDEATARKFTCSTWRWVHGEYNLFDMTASFKQVFEA